MSVGSGILDVSLRLAYLIPKNHYQHTLPASLLSVRDMERLHRPNFAAFSF